jgi:hypothetical protein
MVAAFVVSDGYMVDFFARPGQWVIPGAMTSERRGWMGFLLVLSCFAGCTCGKPQTPVESYCTELATLECDHAIACGRSSASGRGQCIHQSSESGTCRGLAERVNRGFSTFDASAAARCLDSARERAQDCRNLSLIQNGAVGLVGSLGGLPSICALDRVQPEPASPSCGAEAVPAAHSNELCADDLDCIEPGEGCVGVGCAKTCQPAGGLGGPCGRSSCNEGLFCDFVTRVCKMGGAPGERCDVFTPCDSTAGCNQDTGVCDSLPGEGSACAPTIGCVPGNQCDSSATPPTCRRIPTGGESCDWAGSCASPWLCLGGTCQALKNEGESCYLNQCRADLYCNAGLCAPRFAQGTPCANRNLPGFECMQCQLGLTCDPIERTCESQKRVAEGESCTGDAVVCDDQHVCLGAMRDSDGGVGVPGRCEPKQVGVPCAIYSDCPASSNCTQTDDGGTSVCVAASLDSPCFSDDQCQPEHYCEAYKTCRPLRVEGEACDSRAGILCAAKLECMTHGSASVCARRANFGEACDDTAPNSCLSPFGCVSGHCAEVGTPGKPCVVGQYCYVGVCSGGNCKDPKHDGEKCSVNGECRSGICDRGQCRESCD